VRKKGGRKSVEAEERGGFIPKAKVLEVNGRGECKILGRSV
jgi:hypothetical protein